MAVCKVLFPVSGFYSLHKKNVCIAAAKEWGEYDGLHGCANGEGTAWLRFSCLIQSKMRLVRVRHKVGTLSKSMACSAGFGSIRVCRLGFEVPRIGATRSPLLCAHVYMPAFCM